MKTRIILALTLTTLLIALLSTASHMNHEAEASQTYVQLKWTNPMPTNDVAVSDDGNYLAAVNNTGLYFFDSDGPQPLWHYETQAALFSVAISADGEYTVAGDNDGFLHYFNQSTTRTGNQATPTWTTSDMGGRIERGTLDMSADGNYTVVGGTGLSVWYYAGCITKTGTSQGTTWTSGPPAVSDFYTVHISPDGEYVAGGGRRGLADGFVAYYKDATTRTGYIDSTWFAWTQINSIVTDLALSDDGYSVAAIDLGLSSLFYWANATNLTGDPSANWTNLIPFSCVDISGTGNSVVAGGAQAYGSLHFWADSRARQGAQPEDWLGLESRAVLDAAISRDGNLIAASTVTETFNYTAYFLIPDGTIVGEHELHDYCSVVSMSGDGSTTAMAGTVLESLYLFKSSVDSTPPDINEVTQEPDKEDVYPEDEVIIFANVTDDETGVKQVTLNYTTGNGTWFSLTMELQETDIYNCTIPAFPYCTTITYVIIAEDNANNTRTTIQMELQLNYHVIPEFTVPALAAIFAATTLLAAAAHKRRYH